MTSATANGIGADGADGAATLGPLGDLAGYHLRRASHAFAADFAVALEGTGMRQVLFGILAVVAANPGINQSAAGRVLGIQRSNIVLLINQLVDAGLLGRHSAADRRAVVLALTAAGRERLADCLARIEAHEARMLERLTAAERATLVTLLARIGAATPA